MRFQSSVWSPWQQSWQHPHLACHLLHTSTVHRGSPPGWADATIDILGFFRVSSWKNNEGQGVSGSVRGVADWSQAAFGVGMHVYSACQAGREGGKWAGQGLDGRMSLDATTEYHILALQNTHPKEVKDQGDHIHQEQATWVGVSPHPHLRTGMRPKRSQRQDNSFSLYRLRLIPQLKRSETRDLSCG